MKSHVVFVSGDILKASNAGVVDIRRMTFLPRHQGHLPSSALPVPILGGTFREIGMTL